jgi:hypothetical protein
MLDRLYLPVLALAAIAAVALALVFPQGYGDRSPDPFGSTPIQQTPQMQAAMAREAAANQRRINQQRGAMRDMQVQALAPGQ